MLRSIARDSILHALARGSATRPNAPSAWSRLGHRPLFAQELHHVENQLDLLFLWELLLGVRRVPWPTALKADGAAVANELEPFEPVHVPIRFRLHAGDDSLLEPGDVDMLK